MKRILALSFILLCIGGYALAANTPPFGINNQLGYNQNGKWGALGLNTGLYIVGCPNGQNYLSLTTTVSCFPTSQSIVTPLNDPWVTPTGDNIVTP
jgi:hypothetical protein